RADFQARSIDAVLAHVGHHQPRGLSAIRVGAELLDEFDVSPIHVRETEGIVVAVAAKHWQAFAEAVRLSRPEAGRKVVPLVAGDLAGLAANANGGVCEEAHGLGHGSFSGERAHPLSTRHTNTFAS